MFIIDCKNGRYGINQINFYIQCNIIGVLNSMGVIKVSEPQTGLLIIFLGTH